MRNIGEAAVLLREDARSDVVLICDHASNHIPAHYRGLGLSPSAQQEHIAWDIGAGAVTRALSEELNAPAVLGATSRLVVDLNRSPDIPESIPAVSHGVPVPGNEDFDAAQRKARFERYFEPYHAAVDELLEGSTASVLLAVHSFSYELDPAQRDLDVGVLFDRHESLSRELADRLNGVGLRTRLNEPYSGKSGVVFSTRTHGTRHGIAYLELEINQRLLPGQAEAASFARRLAPAIRWLGAEAAVRRSEPRAAQIRNATP